MQKDGCESAAITIQKHIRGFLARKHYGIKELDSGQHTSEKTMIVGNDPVLPDLSSFKTADKIALIGTSGMRNIAIACEVGGTQHVPKIIIVDISDNVCKFWRNFRTFITSIKQESEFISNLMIFLETNKELYDHQFDEKHLQKPDIIPDLFGNSFLNQNPVLFFQSLIKQHGYAAIRAIAMHVTVIKQNWADPAVFTKLSNILTANGINKIYLYPSNIVACCNPEVGNKILQNIETVKPVFSIHTNACLFHSRAEKSYLFVDQSPDAIRQKISEASHPNHTTLELVKLQLAELGHDNTNNNDADDLMNWF